MLELNAVYEGHNPMNPSKTEKLKNFWKRFFRAFLDEVIEMKNDLIRTDAEIEEYDDLLHRTMMP